MKYRIGFLVFLLILINTVTAFASAGSANPSQFILQQTINNSRTLQTLQGTYNVNVALSMGKDKFQFTIPLEFALQKPNKCRVNIKCMGDELQMVYDGSKLYQYMPSQHQYIVTNISLDSDKDLKQFYKRFTGIDPSFLMGSDFQMNFLENMSAKAKYFGKRMVNNHETDVVQIPFESWGLVKYWIGTQDRLCYRADVDINIKTLITALSQLKSWTPEQKRVFQEIKCNMEKMTAKVHIEAVELKADQSLDPQSFQFKVPADAKEVTSFKNLNRSHSKNK